MFNVKNKASDGSREVSIAKLFPNMITALGLCFGLSSIKLAMSLKFELAVAFIFIAAILDMMDGGVARALNAQSEFGEVFDSLCDFINFGFCPIFITYLWSLSSIRFFGWGLVLLCSICMAIRLSRFNSQISLNTGHPVRSKFFYGIPAPASAILILMPLIASFEFDDAKYLFTQAPQIAMIYIVLIALLTVSVLPTFSLKNIKVKEKYLTPIMITLIIFVIALFLERWKTVLFFMPLYLLSIPLSFFKFKRLDKEFKNKQKNR
jgi:CDP-diacylglycerol--serine O-phosphatidyltransferase